MPRSLHGAGGVEELIMKFTLARDDTESQLTPVRLTLPSPIRARMSDGVSVGPLANGV